VGADSFDIDNLLAVVNECGDAVLIPANAEDREITHERRRPSHFNVPTTGTISREKMPVRFIKGARKWGVTYYSVLLAEIRKTDGRRQ
jgi:hypothetical protein